MGFNAAFGVTCDSGKIGGSEIVHKGKDILLT